MSPFDYLNAVTTGHRRRVVDESRAVVPPRHCHGGVRAGGLGCVFYRLPQHFYVQFVERTIAGIDEKRHHF